MVLFSLPAEATHEVSGEANIGNGLPDGVDKRQIGLSGVVPPHLHQHLRTPALGREVNIVAHIWV